MKFFLCLLLIIPSLAFPSPLKISATPNWVILQSVDLSRPIPHEEISGGIYFRMVDWQQKDAIDQQDSDYRHYAETAVNEHGVESISKINIEYDPSYESIVFHSLIVWRDGKPLDKSQSARTTILQREDEMADNIYNGLHTLNIIISDVRIGDTVDYSYSIIGSNPLFQDSFSATIPLEWSIPVGKLYLRILSEKQKPLNYLFNHPGNQLDISREGDFTAYIYEASDLPGQETDNNIPDWHEPYSTLYISEHNNWGEIASWANPLFSKAIETPEEIRKIASSIMRSHSSKPARIAKALQYVQKEIRYLGLEISNNTHEPFPASTTLKRRYGDCKDKAVLLISILKAMEINSTPALVNTSRERSIANTPPSIRAFNHVIVHLQTEGKDYWLDPTRRYQGGNLDSLSQPDYGVALLLSPDAIQLTKMSPLRPSPSEVIAREIIDLTSQDQSEVYFANHSVYTGSEAEYQRSRIAGKGITKIREDYLSFYRDYYNEISIVDGVVFTDDIENNRIESDERYRISGFWDIDTDTGKKYATFYPNIISDYLEIPDKKPRTSPYFLEHPVHIKQRITVKFGDTGWHFNDSQYEDDNDWFTFTSTVLFSEDSNQLILDYEYQSKTDFVGADTFPDYIQHLNNADDHLDYGIYRHLEIQEEPHLSDETNWPFVIFSIVILGFLIIGIWWRIDARKHPYHEQCQYFPVSSTKFIYMSIITFNLYQLYWFYRNWKYVRKTYTPTIMPFFRAFFASLWYFPLYQRLRKEQPSGLPPLLAGAGLAMLYFFFMVLSSVNLYGWLFMIGSMLVTLPLLSHINYINRSTPSAQKTHSRLGARHYLLGALTAPLILLSIGGESGLMPHESAAKGARLWSHDLQFMQRQGIIDPGEEIIYFYSDAWLSLRADGNGFTQNQVFSYWKDDDDQLQIETAAYEEISDIDVTWSTNWNENTIVRIERSDGSDFLLYVSNSDYGDKTFINSLQKQWESKKLPQGS